MSYRLLTYLTVFMIAMSCFPVLPFLDLSVSAQHNIEIGDFDVSFADGAELVDGKLVWTPKYSDPGHSFVYRITFTLSGEGSFEPGEVQVRVPMHILTDRYSVIADECDLSVPSREDVEAYEGDLSGIDASFVYETEGDHYLITNFGSGNNALSAGDTGYIEIGYRAVEETFEYVDMAPSESFDASLAIYDGTTLIARQSGTAPPVHINTGAELIQTRKRCLNIVAPYSSWVSTWGEAPANAGDYYYLVWEITSYIGKVTQPYSFVIDDFVDEPDAEPIAYRMWQDSTFRSSNHQDNLRAENFTRYDYVITRHLKSTYNAVESYQITNHETASVVPVDCVDPPSSISATSRFNYFRREYGGPGTSFYHHKWGNNNWHERFGYLWEIADYGLQDLRDGLVEYLSGNIKFFVETASFAFRYTLADGARADQTEMYGVRNVTSTLTDDSFYMNDSIYQDKNDRVIIPEDAVKLTSEDFSVDYVKYTVNLQDAEFSEIEGAFVPKQVEYQDCDVIKFYAKFGDNDTWLLVGKYDLAHNRAIDIDENYVISLTNERIDFRPDCVGYRIEVSNPHYSTQIGAWPYCRIKNSEYVLQQAGDSSVEKIWLTNVSDYEAHDNHDVLLHQSRSMSRDYIVGVDKLTEFDKRVITSRNNPLHRNITIGWKVSLSEYYMSNFGIVYIPQDEGVFYDLLPKGCGIDASTVAVATDMNNGEVEFLEPEDYDITITDNFRNSGRTMLQVKVKEQFTRVVLTYETVYTWDSMIENGSILHNTTVYETGNELLGNGRHDDGGDIIDSEIVRDLDPDTDDRRFFYAEHDCQIRFVVASFTGLYKKVKSSLDIDFSENTKISQNSVYSYKLRYSTSAISRAKDMILFDSLENFSFERENPDTHLPERCISQWKGTLEYVDISQARDEMGIEPVVYYSSIDGLDINEHNDLDEIVSGERVWKTADEFGDISQAKAVAVDLRHDSDGNDYILDYRSAVSVTLYMRSPAEDNTQSADPTNYNNVFMKNTVIDLLENETDGFIHQDKTEVHFRAAGSFTLEKRSSTTNEPVKGIEFTLSGTSAYNTPVLIKKRTDKNGQITFIDVEMSMGNRDYILSETGGSDDYLPLDHTFSVKVDNRGKVTIDSVPADEADIFLITDDPRIHADVEFYKRDLVSKTLLNNAYFRLEGKSDYGNDILDERFSEDGRVCFPNVEKGTYTMREFKFVQDSGLINQYICNEEVYYTVVVDGDGNFSITSSSPEYFDAKYELNGTYSIYNEYYHKFGIQKTSKGDGTALRGAKYRLTDAAGVSKEATTDEGGHLFFEKLDSGTYTLCEIEAPESFAIDEHTYLVEITPDNRITITDNVTGAEIPKAGEYYPFTDVPDGSIVIIKKWEDTDESRQSRLSPERLIPVIHISYQPKFTEAYFWGAVHDNFIYASALKYVTTDPNRITSFQPYTGDTINIRELLAEKGAVRVDDDSTGSKIYAWIQDNGEGDTGAVYWWSEAQKVYLKNETRFLCARLPNIKKIDMRNIDTSKIDNMSSMFRNDSSLTSMNLEGFDSSNVIDMNYMFCMCGPMTNVDFSKLNTKKVYNMDGMFYACNKDGFTQFDLSVFDSTSCTSMVKMFYSCGKLTSVTIGSFDTSNVKSMSGMFDGCGSLQQIDAQNIKTDSAINLSTMFNGCFSLQTINVRQWETGNCENMSSMFSQCGALNSLDVSQWNTESCENMSYMFFRCGSMETFDVKDWKTGSCKNMEAMFSQCGALNNLDVSDWNVYSCEKTRMMFYRCGNLRSLNVSKWKTDNITNMEAMFQYCSELTTLDVSEWDTHSCENMGGIFYNCFVLNPIDVSEWKTGNVKEMGGMFANCRAITSLDVSKWDTHSCESTNTMFSNCRKLTSLDLSKWDMSNCKNMGGMFRSCVCMPVIDISGFDTSSVTDMTMMFYTDAITNLALTTVYVSDLWKTTQVQNSTNMFGDLPNLVGGNGTPFDTTHIDKEYARIDGKDGLAGYFTYKDPPNNTGSGAKTATKIRTTSSSAGTDDQNKISFVSTDTEHCTIVILDDNTYEYTFTGVDETKVYYTWEDIFEGYVSENMGDTNHKKVENGKAVIVNRAEELPKVHYGSLSVKKLLENEDGSELTEEQLQKTFTFRIRLFDENQQPVTDAALYGTVPYGANGAEITLKHDETKTLTDIPAGYTYTVTETSESGYTSSVTEGTESGTIIADDTVSVTYTNTALQETLTSFKVKKIVDGRFETTDEEYNFTVLFRGLHSGSTYEITGARSMTFTASSAETQSCDFTLKNGEEVEISLPIGAHYMVEEKGGNYTSKYIITNSGAQGSIYHNSDSTGNRTDLNLNTAWELAEAGEEILVTFTNTKDVRQDLTLVKKVVNAGNNYPFSFYIELFLPSDSQYTINMERTNANNGTKDMFRKTTNSSYKIEMSIELHGDDSLVIHDLPVGTKYRITEEECDYLSSYQLTNSGKAGMILSQSASNNLPRKALTTGLPDNNGEYTDAGMEIVNEGEEITVTYTNTKLQHDITIEKNTDMTYTNMSPSEYRVKKFSFTVELTGLTAGKEYSMEFTSKKVTGIVDEKTFTAEADRSAEINIELSDGEACRIADLPENAQYRVTEAETAHYRSAYAITGNQGALISISSGSNNTQNLSLSTSLERVDVNDYDIRISFTNTFDASGYILPAAGSKNANIYLTTACAGILLFAVVFLYVNRKKIKQQ